LNIYLNQIDHQASDKDGEKVYFSIPETKLPLDPSETTTPERCITHRRAKGRILQFHKKGTGKQLDIILQCHQKRHRRAITTWRDGREIKDKDKIGKLGEG
jgi:hypothetical protein